MKLTLISLLLASVINIIPAPLSVKEDKGVFKLKGSPISCDSQMGDKALQAVAEFSSQLTLCAGQIYPVSKPSGLSENVRKGEVKGI